MPSYQTWGLLQGSLIFQTESNPRAGAVFQTDWGLLEDSTMVGTQQWEPGGAQDSLVVECQVCPQSTFPASSQVTDTGRLLHTLPRRSHLSHSVLQVLQVPCSPAGSLVRSHPSFHSPVPGTLLGVEKKKNGTTRNCRSP